MPDLLKKKAIAIKIMPQSNKILKIGFIFSMQNTISHFCGEL